MLNLNPASLISGGNGRLAPFRIVTIADANYTACDLAVKVTALPSQGVVLKEDGITQIVLGQMIRDAELAALKFRPAAAATQSAIGSTIKPKLEIWFVLSVPQDGEPRAIEIPAPGQSVQSYVEITELPSNGTVRLADGTTAVRGQTLSFAELNGLTFAPAADACGKISILQYRTGGPAETAVTGGVLVVVGPDALPMDMATEAPAADNNADSNIVASVATALLLDAALSASNSTAMASPSDLNEATPLEVAARNLTQASLTDVPAAGQVSAPPPSIPMQVHTLNTGNLNTGNGEPASPGANTTATDDPPPHRIGSSTPPPATMPSSTTVLQGAAPLAGQTAPNGVSTSSPATKPDALSTGGTSLSSPATTLLGVSANSALPQITTLQAAPASTSAAQGSVSTFAANSLTSNAVTLNPIVLENEKKGVSPDVWQVDPGEDSTTIVGFTTAISTNIGGTVNFKIDNLTGNANYQINIYRLGYYGGDGATLAATIAHNASSAVVQPAAIVNPATGEVDAGNWSVTDSWAIPSTATSGVYVANIVDGSQIFQIPFVVKDPNSTSDIVFQTDDETWQAYNGWGGANLYGGNGPSDPPDNEGDEAVPGAAFAVSYNRPIVVRDGIGQFAGPQDSVFGAEYAAIYWMEENGYDVSYISGMDAATDGSLLLNHKVFMDAGHDEYWTDSQVANVEAAKAAGVNLVFLSGNEIFWQTQFAPSIDGSATANRTLVSYKDSHFESLINPTGQGTGAFEAPVSWGGTNTPSNALTGQLFSVDQTPTLGTITIPFDMTKLRFWRNTSIANTVPGQTASLEPGLLGYEWDSSPDNGFMPAGLIDLSSTTLQEPTVNAEFGNVDETGTATHNLVEYRDPTSGALVFGAGTVFWSWGLSSEHDPGPDGNTTSTDPNVQQAMVNVFADMGVQPQTLQASLIIASASTDLTAPTSKVTNVSSTSVVEGGSITVTGTATDVGGVIGGVQISTDGGKTWHTTSGQIGTQSVNWTYTFNAAAPGTYSIETRAVDDSLNLETPGSGTAYTVTPSAAISIFSSSDTPAVLDVSDKQVEVGTKFTAATSGEITAIRFYKGPLNTGTHIGDIWSSTGTLLGTATFTDETASGWQQVNLTTPVKITAGATYIVSYNTNGNYSDTPDYFDNYFGQSNGSLTAPGDAANGIYAYGTGSVFPTILAPSADNYWVDVVFDDGSNLPQAVNDSGFTVTENGTLTIAASKLLANDTDPAGLPFSIASVGSAVNGTVSYSTQTQTVTFIPNAGYAGAASFTYTISDTSGATATGEVSANVEYPVSAQSLFGTNDTPSVIASNDFSPVELGVKFTASVNGTITGLRFYKGAGNIGTHVADLWSATGTLLATATFTSETASGWQEVNFASPVTITAGTTYVASYHTSGDYSDTPNYFTASLTNGELTAPSGSNGVYAYGAGGIFPTNTFDASNYWVDVVFNGSSVTTSGPPVANNDSGFVVNENGSITIAASALLANDSDPGGLPLTITGVSNPTNGTVSYDQTAKTATFTPNAGYTGEASFSYTISDTAGGTATASVGLLVDATSAESLFSLASVPGTVTANDPKAVELGVRFTADANGTITGLRFYKGPENTGLHVADLWSSNGTLLATATFTNETASGWQQVSFSSPVLITAGTTYIASYHTNGDYSADNGYFANPVVSGDLTAPAGSNGVYTYGAAGSFPTSTFDASNYWVDIVYAKAGQPPVANNDSGFTVDENESITISSATLLANDTDPNGLPLTITGVSNAANGSVSYDANAKAATFTPNAGYTGPASFTYSVTDSSGATASANVSLTVNNTGTVTLFSPTSTPAVTTVNDPNPVELGFKFQANTDGEITGLRFYKGPENTGTHVADLWSSNGTLLATATFTNETASGWQQVTFSNPVEITAGTTYVASYHTNGDYSADPNLFATAQTNGPLTAPSSSSSGGNGVYAYGSASLFPTNSFNSTSYGVDVLFKAQLAT
jgi:hypothetical protein